MKRNYAYTDNTTCGRKRKYDKDAQHINVIVSKAQFEKLQEIGGGVVTNGVHTLIDSYDASINAGVVIEGTTELQQLQAIGNGSSSNGLHLLLTWYNSHRSKVRAG